MSSIDALNNWWRTMSWRNAQASRAVLSIFLRNPTARLDSASTIETQSMRTWIGKAGVCQIPIRELTQCRAPHSYQSLTFRVHITIFLLPRKTSQKPLSLPRTENTSVRGCPLGLPTPREPSSNQSTACSATSGHKATSSRKLMISSCAPIREPTTNNFSKTLLIFSWEPGSHSDPQKPDLDQSG